MITYMKQICPKCHNLIHVRKNGLLYRHGWKGNIIKGRLNITKNNCSGSGLRPNQQSLEKWL